LDTSLGLNKLVKATGSSYEEPVNLLGINLELPLDDMHVLIKGSS
jgi:hypothetical protein